eukprot:MONOS_1577.1-p1 / transcript=MONOS_1577.1 / gene=MONOS_1577 / organism=Monocercomonoides_exilis_PA203 / gene_product=unspecified product / transcript_product=unspecified product / location=Mono_scaffold00028:95820-100664(-) / protein_length=1615 / sequence_SO=supercontig / SO=protein_coding / is_pseudo=false
MTSGFPQGAKISLTPQRNVQINNDSGLKLREDKDRGMMVVGAAWRRIASVDDILSVLKVSDENVEFRKKAGQKACIAHIVCSLELRYLDEFGRARLNQTPVKMNIVKMARWEPGTSQSFSSTVQTTSTASASTIASMAAMKSKVYTAFSTVLQCLHSRKVLERSPILDKIRASLLEELQNEDDWRSEEEENEEKQDTSEEDAQTKREKAHQCLVDQMIQTWKAENLSAKPLPHVPYRDSKLTYFLKDTLNERSNILFIHTLIPTIPVKQAETLPPHSSYSPSSSLTRTAYPSSVTESLIIPSSSRKLAEDVLSSLRYTARIRAFCRAGLTMLIESEGKKFEREKARLFSSKTDQFLEERVDEYVKMENDNETFREEIDEKEAEEEKKEDNLESTDRREEENYVATGPEPRSEISSNSLEKSQEKPKEQLTSTKRLPPRPSSSQIITPRIYNINPIHNEAKPQPSASYQLPTQPSSATMRSLSSPHRLQSSLAYSSPSQLNSSQSATSTPSRSRYSPFSSTGTSPASTNAALTYSPTYHHSPSSPRELRPIFSNLSSSLKKAPVKSTTTMSNSISVPMYQSGKVTENQHLRDVIRHLEAMLSERDDWINEMKERENNEKEEQERKMAQREKELTSQREKKNEELKQEQIERSRVEEELKEERERLAYLEAEREEEKKQEEEERNRMIEEMNKERQEWGQKVAEIEAEKMALRKEVNELMLKGREQREADDKKTKMRQEECEKEAELRALMLEMMKNVKNILIEGKKKKFKDLKSKQEDAEGISPAEKDFSITSQKEYVDDDEEEDDLFDLIEENQVLSNEEKQPAGPDNETDSQQLKKPQSPQLLAIQRDQNIAERLFRAIVKEAEETRDIVAAAEATANKRLFEDISEMNSLLSVHFVRKKERESEQKFVDDMLNQVKHKNRERIEKSGYSSEKEDDDENTENASNKSLVDINPIEKEEDEKAEKLLKHLSDISEFLTNSTQSPVSRMASKQKIQNIKPDNSSKTNNTSQSSLQHSLKEEFDISSVIPLMGRCLHTSVYLLSSSLPVVRQLQNDILVVCSQLKEDSIIKQELLRQMNKQQVLVGLKAAEAENELKNIETLARSYLEKREAEDDEDKEKNPKNGKDGNEPESAGLNGIAQTFEEVASVSDDHRQSTEEDNELMESPYKSYCVQTKDISDQIVPLQATSLTDTAINQLSSPFSKRVMLMNQKESDEDPSSKQTNDEESKEISDQHHAEEDETENCAFDPTQTLPSRKQTASSFEKSNSLFGATDITPLVIEEWCRDALIPFNRTMQQVMNLISIIEGEVMKMEEYTEKREISLVNLKKLIDKVKAELKNEKDIGEQRMKEISEDFLDTLHKHGDRSSLLSSTIRSNEENDINTDGQSNKLDNANSEGCDDYLLDEADSVQDEKADDNTKDISNEQISFFQPQNPSENGKGEQSFSFSAAGTSLFFLPELSESTEHSQMRQKSSSSSSSASALKTHSPMLTSSSFQNQSFSSMLPSQSDSIHSSEDSLQTSISFLSPTSGKSFVADNKQFKSKLYQNTRAPKTSNANEFRAPSKRNDQENIHPMKISSRSDNDSRDKKKTPLQQKPKFKTDIAPTSLEEWGKLMGSG